MPTLTAWQKLAVAVFVGALSWLTWILRFDLYVAGGGQGSAASGYVLDRWTGAVHFVAPTIRRELQPPLDFSSHGTPDNDPPKSALDNLIEEAKKGRGDYRFEDGKPANKPLK